MVEIMHVEVRKDWTTKGRKEYGEWVVRQGLRERRVGWVARGGVQ